jgi:hypothetical protein
MYDFIKAVLGSGAGTLIVGLIFKHKFDHELETQKAYLQRTSRIHDRQVDVLINLYKHLQEAHIYLHAMSRSAIFEGEKPEEWPELLQNALIKAEDAFKSGRLLLPATIVAQYHEFYSQMLQGQLNLSLAHHPALADGMQRAEYCDRAKKIAYRDIPPLLEAIEKSGREIIHGEVPNNKPVEAHSLKTWLSRLRRWQGERK